MAQRIRYEYRRPGRPTTHYDEWLVLDRPDLKVLLLERYEGPEVSVAGRSVLEAGAPIVWCVFPEKWHDIGRFHLEDGSLTGWYTNLCRPVQLAEDRWVGSDLFLDLWQPVEGEPQWLDEEELAEAVRSGLIDRATQRRIQNEQTIIDLQLRQGAWPPPVARDIDLEQARALKAES
jgi:predicted RNA-binding protein associated with RNAse of E/G family